MCVCASLEPLHHLPHPVQSCLTEFWWRDPVVVASVTLCDCQAHLWGQVMIRYAHTQAHSYTCNCFSLLVSIYHLLLQAEMFHGMSSQMAVNFFFFLPCTCGSPDLHTKSGVCVFVRLSLAEKQIMYRHLFTATRHLVSFLFLLSATSCFISKSTNTAISIRVGVFSFICLLFLVSKTLIF